jgi:hypothetical protein
MSSAWSLFGLKYMAEVAPKIYQLLRSVDTSVPLCINSQTILEYKIWRSTASLTDPERAAFVDQALLSTSLNIFQVISLCKHSF